MFISIEVVRIEGYIVHSYSVKFVVSRVLSKF
jgi:hypothetical protein